MRRASIVAGLALLAIFVTQAPAFAAASFSNVTAATSGPVLMISFTESGTTICGAIEPD